MQLFAKLADDQKGATPTLLLWGLWGFCLFFPAFIRVYGLGHRLLSRDLPKARQL